MFEIKTASVKKADQWWEREYKTIQSCHMHLWGKLHTINSFYKALNTPATIDFTVGYSILNNSAQSKHETIQYHQRAICWYKSNTDNTSNSKNNRIDGKKRKTHTETMDCIAVSLNSVNTIRAETDYQIWKYSNVSIHSSSASATVKHVILQESNSATTQHNTSTC